MSNIRRSRLRNLYLFDCQLTSESMGQLNNHKFPAIELLNLGSFLGMQIATLSGGLIF